jgi:hypothetical protein
MAIPAADVQEQSAFDAINGHEEELEEAVQLNSNGDSRMNCMNTRAAVRPLPRTASCQHLTYHFVAFVTTSFPQLQWVALCSSPSCI